MGLTLGRVDSMWTRAWMVVTREKENRRGTWDAGRAGSVGRERMLVGCGCGSGTDAGWVWYFPVAGTASSKNGTTQ